MSTTKLFTFPEKSFIISQIQKEEEGFLEKIQPIGAQIVKLVERQEFENFKQLVFEGSPLLMFMQEKVVEAYFTALQLKDQEFVEFFVKNGLNLKMPPCDESIMVLTKVSKYCVEDPPIEILDALLENGCNPNYFGDKGRSALCYAVKHGNVPFVKKLIEKGAIINIADDKKNKPLFYINEKLKLEPKNENFIAVKKLLVENKAEL